MEPCVRIDLVALDGDQPTARIWRAYRDVHRFARRIVLFTEIELQLGIAVERTRNVGGARHRVLDAVHLHAVATAHNDQGIVTRLVGRQRVIHAIGRNGQRLLVERNFLELGLVLVDAGILFGQYGDVASLDQPCLELLERHRLGRVIDGHQVHAARRGTIDVIKVVHRLVADQPVIVGHQRLRRGSHGATAFGLISLGQEIQLVGGIGVLLEVQIELGMPLIVGLTVLQRLFVALLGTTHVVEVVVRPATERRPCRSQGQRCLDSSVCCRRAEQVHHIDHALDLVRLHPALGHLAGEFGFDLHTIRQEFLDLHGCAANLRARLAVLDDVQVHRPGAGGCGFGRPVLQFAKARCIHRHRQLLHRHAARIDNFSLQRNADHAAGPAGGAHDQADMERVTWTVDTAVGEQVRRQLPLALRIAFAAHVEAREVEFALDTAVATHGEK